jgi:ABC-type transport system involved in cytochrome bd biosynthesis fused ATPase/permease subunit
VTKRSTLPLPTNSQILPENKNTRVSDRAVEGVVLVRQINRLVARLREEMAGEGNGDEGWRRSGIEVSALQFGYDGQPPLFARFNLRVAPGSRCLLVGANGSGRPGPDPRFHPRFI